MEASNLPDIKFKAMVIRMPDSIKRDKETIKNNQSEIKNTISEMRNILGRINCRLRIK